MAAMERGATGVDAQVGANVRRLREQKGRTQQELADSLVELGWKVGATSVTKIEKGSRALRVAELALVAAALEVTAAELLGSSDPRDLASAHVNAAWVSLRDLLSGANEFFLNADNALQVLAERPELAVEVLGVAVASPVDFYAQARIRVAEFGTWMDEWPYGVETDEELAAFRSVLAAIADAMLTVAPGVRGIAD